MAQFVWDQTDVLSGLGVEPVIDEEYASLHYEVHAEDCRLSLTVFADSHPSVKCTLARLEGDAPFVSFLMQEVAEIRHRRDEDIEELIFVPSQESEFPATVPFGFILRTSPILAVRFGDPTNPVTALCPPS